MTPQGKVVSYWSQRKKIRCDQLIKLPKEKKGGYYAFICKTQLSKLIN